MALSCHFSKRIASQIMRKPLLAAGKKLSQALNMSRQSGFERRTVSSTIDRFSCAVVSVKTRLVFCLCSVLLLFHGAIDRFRLQHMRRGQGA